MEKLSRYLNILILANGNRNSLKTLPETKTRSDTGFLHNPKIYTSYEDQS